MRKALVALIQLRQVSKQYGPRRVLDAADLTIDPGQFLLIEGPNGCGKTTLLRLLSGYARPTAGSLTWMEGAKEFPVRSKRHLIGVVADEPMLYDELNAAENVDLMRTMARSSGTAHQALARFGAQNLPGPVGKLSRGQKQRVALARAFVHAPRLLLLDEPTTGLDEEGVVRLVEALKDRGGAAAIIATHDPVPFAQICTRRFRLSGGKLVEVPIQ